MTATTQTDVISDLAGITPGSPLAALRAQRPEAMEHAQGSYAALFDPPNARGLSQVERLAAALRVATLHSATNANAHYQTRLVGAGADREVVAEAAQEHDPQMSSSVPPRLKAVLYHADLLATQPVQARPDDLQSLVDAGLTTPDIVTLAQVIAFVSFQVRVLFALQLIDGQSSAAVPAVAPPLVRVSCQPSSTSTTRVLRPGPELKRPTVFTVDQLQWTPWLEPLERQDADPEQLAYIEGVRGNSPYFRLLAHNLPVLTERTATDRGIFYTHEGAPRAERELAAAATSRLNGCIYCASVHARNAAQLSKRPEDIDRLLLKGVAPGTDLGLDDRWQGVVDLAVALASTPPRATTQHVARLRELGLSDLEILDVAQSGAFFAWANRLMLTLGEPHYPEEHAP